MTPSRLVAMLILIAGLVVPIGAAGQPAPGVHRIGFINSGPPGPNAKNVAAFRAGMADLGYVEGRNLEIVFRWGEQKADQLPTLASELVNGKPEVIVSTGGAPTVRAVKAATATIPIVFITGNPIAEQVVPSLARPGGNLTGLAVLAGDLEAKRLEMLKLMLPRAKRIAIVWNPAQPYVDDIVQSVEGAARRLDITLLQWKARNRQELELAFAEIAEAKADALCVIADPVLGFERDRIVNFATKNHLPGIYFWREFAEIGGLASYGTNLAAVYRRAATYVDKILKGAKPGDLPVEQPTTFELVINRSTAKALGITLPPAVLQRADEVID
jgi:putative tryptophan/tyrosine transport system substrate-binding protein